MGETEATTWSQFHEGFSALEANIAQVVVAPRRTIRFALLGLFARGHVLLEDLPGVGKTLLSKTIAQSVSGQFSRIQFTPDLLPTDITGGSIFDMRENRFEFVPGPIFANIVLADEVNRTGPRTQSALLEAMGEQQVTADGVIRALPRPFMVIATQNTVESYGTFPLPNSQLDRFLVSMNMGLPSGRPLRCQLAPGGQLAGLKYLFESSVGDDLLRAAVAGPSKLANSLKDAFSAPLTGVLAVAWTVGIAVVLG